MAANTASPVAVGAAAQIQAAGGAAATAGAATTRQECATPPKSPSKPPNGKKKQKAKKKKKSKEDTPRCVGYYLDALDKKMLWAEAKIIACDVGKQKLRVHFIGWGKAHDIWTDTVSIAPHGRYAHKSKASNPMSWDGNMRLFEEMLGPIDASTPRHGREILGEDAANGGTVISAGVAPPPPPTPSQRRATKAKEASSSSAAPKERKPTSLHHSKAKSPSRKRPQQALVDPRPAPTKRRAPSPSLPEIGSVQIVGDVGGSAKTALVELEARRRQLAEELEHSASFLERCAGVFKRQLSELMSA